MLTHTEKRLNFSLDDISFLKTLLCRISTRFHYHETDVKPLTLHAKDALFSGRGCKAQRIQFHRGGIATAGYFSLDPHKSEFFESHQETFHENMLILCVLYSSFVLPSQCQKLSVIGDQTQFSLVRNQCLIAESQVSRLCTLFPVNCRKFFIVSCFAVDP